MATTKGALEKSIFFQKLVLKESTDPKQKERARKAIEKLQAELDGLTIRTSNPAKRKFSPAQLAAQKLFAERSRSGALKKAKPGVKADSVLPTLKSNPIQDAGEFVMTVNGKSKTRFFVHDDDQWARSYGFEYRLLSDVTQHGAPVKFTKTRAIVATDEDANGKPITDTWSIRDLKFYKTNPDTETISLYKTASGKTAMKIQHHALSDTFSYIGEYGAGSGANYSTMKNEVSMMLKYHPGVTLASGENFITLGDDVGKRRRNPDKTKPRAYVRRVSQVTGEAPNKRLRARRKANLTGPAGYFPNPKVKYTNTAKELKGDQRVGYSVHLASNPSYLAMAWFTKKSDAVSVATEAANRTGLQLAVSRAQIYFGALE